MRPHSVVLLTLLATSASAQQPTPPPIRPIGPIEHVTKDSLLSVSSAVPTSGGRVFVNDGIGHRVLLYDSTLSKYTVVIDSTGPNAYTGRFGSVVPYRGDSALFISLEALAMTVLTPTGTVGRIMATPTLPRGYFTTFFPAAFDSSGRMVYFYPIFAPFRPPADANSPFVSQSPDSSMLVRFDLVARKLDTVAFLRVSSTKNTQNRKDGVTVSITISINPLPVGDDWAMTADGSLAIVRGRDYHVDWLTPDGKWTSTPRMAFAWEHFSDEQKRALLDSVVRRQQFVSDSFRDIRIAQAQQRGDAVSGRGSSVGFRNIYEPVELRDVNDYRAPISGQGSTRADLDGNLWIRTTLVVDKRPVYDVVNRRGEVVDRVQLPQNRFFAGVGRGVIYMGVLDSLRVAHLERARIK